MTGWPMRWRGALRIALAAAVATGAAAACATRSEDEDGGREAQGGARITELAQPAPALGEPLMLSLAMAKNHHHKADVYLHEGNVEAAVTEIKAILSIPFPGGAPEGEDVLLDARARLAKLLAGQGKLEDAMKAADDGIIGTSRESFFLANLDTVRGEVLEARAAALDGRDANSARELRRDAIRAYDTAIQIERRLLAVAGGGGGGGDEGER